MATLCEARASANQIGGEHNRERNLNGISAVWEGCESVALVGDVLIDLGMNWIV